ncbi:MAG: class I SAM-dependent methyltransferase, partial [Candidatus Aminicenantes bacterium]|nr:class I SAM-dependent methyltransferase [Candidatus Aminicenantes bacterium]
MRRTIEKLAYIREIKEKEFKSKLDEINFKLETFINAQKNTHPQELFSELNDLLEHDSIDQALFNRRIVELLREQQKNWENTNHITNQLFSLIRELEHIHFELVDAKDKEYDALSSNHVGMIFKSMEWRVSHLAAETEDANILMKKFILLREYLDRLLAVLNKGEKPSPSQVEKILLPLKEWKYTGFENRYRGSENDVKKQQEPYLQYFQPTNKKVLDLGCGRGEFIETLRKQGISAEGIDLNEQMIEICRDKGLKCRKADILDTLTEQDDSSLGGIFSSQVIEHLTPDYLGRMIELAYIKLAPSTPIILETVNPLSLFALVQIYFLDLTHQQPIHPQALKFLLECNGFENIEIKYSG